MANQSIEIYPNIWLPVLISASSGNIALVLKYYPKTVSCNIYNELHSFQSLKKIMSGIEYGRSDSIHPFPCFYNFDTVKRSSAV